MIPLYKDLPETIKKYVPDFEYIIADLGFSDKDAKLEEEHRIVIKTLNRARYASKEEILDIFKEATIIYVKHKNKDMVEYYIIQTMVYILSSRDDLKEDELREIVGEITEEGGELFMTLVEKWKQEGIEKGIEEGRLIIAEDMIKNGEPIEKIMLYTKFNEDIIKVLKLKLNL